MTTKERFLQATKDWYSYVNKDHHKDRDCHWMIGIEKEYSYGEDAKESEWFVQHNGYITEFYESADTEEEAMKKAADFIEEFIRENPHDPT